MGILTPTGVLECADPAGSLKQLLDASNERFDSVTQTANTVDAKASNLRELVMRGPRTHPLLPFSRAHFELIDGSPVRLRYVLDARWSLALFGFLAAAASLLANLADGPRGVVVIASFFAGVYLINLLFARIRALAWLHALSAKPKT